MPKSTEMPRFVTRKHHSAGRDALPRVRGRGGPRPSPNRLAVRSGIRLPHSNAGAALLLSLGYLAALGVMVSVFYSSLHRAVDQKIGVEHYIVTLNIAEGGLHKAIAALNDPSKQYGGEENTRLGQGQFSVRVSETGEGGLFFLEVTAARMSGGQPLYRVRIQAHARRAGNRWSLSNYRESTLSLWGEE